MGDDIPDIKMMKVSGISACPPNSVAEVKEISDYISPIYGGKGAGNIVTGKQIGRAHV